MLSYSYRFFTDKKNVWSIGTLLQNFMTCGQIKKKGKNKQEKRERKISKDIVKD